MNRLSALTNRRINTREGILCRKNNSGGEAAGGWLGLHGFSNWMLKNINNELEKGNTTGRNLYKTRVFRKKQFVFFRYI
ncbi:MAG: hypothetical protein BGO52_10985 [Sphingobacteriales bacterium 44-61]|nr:MAG: hypothetical protein BGO52_10985 [Sphingobacteriales bacterium 44-61]